MNYWRSSTVILSENMKGMVSISKHIQFRIVNISSLPWGQSFRGIVQHNIGCCCGVDPRCQKLHLDRNTASYVSLVKQDGFDFGNLETDLYTWVDGFKFS